MNIQTKFLALLQAAVEKAGFEFIHNTGWANTGTVLVMNGLVTLSALSYNFQGRYATFTLKNPRVGVTVKEFHYVQFMSEPERLQEVIDLTVSTAGNKPPKAVRRRTA